MSAKQKITIYSFGGSAVISSSKNPEKKIVGGKGLGLQVMTKIGVDVPPGFTLPTTLCQVYTEHNDLPAQVWEDVEIQMQRVEKDMQRVFGDKQNPLLVSVRSGAAISMPGMMDTVLNIGLNKDNVESLAAITGNNERFAWDSYRRLINMYGDVVKGIPHEAFEEKLDELKKKVGATNDVELNAEQLKELCDDYKNVFIDNGQVFPEDPKEQLKSCILAVFGSWNSERAIKYREINGIKNLIGTAANVQAMVFGNMGESSGTGVAFSRNPSTGENKLYGEFLSNAQGEDVVAGIRTPEPIAKMEKIFPSAYNQFIKNIEKLERYFKDMQDVEFTVENEKLWMLQCRSGKRTGPAALQIAIDLVKEGICKEYEALLLVEPDHVKQLLHPNFKPEILKSKEYADSIIVKGLPGGPGAAVGKLVFTAKRAEEEKTKGEDVILVRLNTSPEDVGGMWAAKGILTAKGGMTSHAAVVARGWGKPCVCGCTDLDVKEDDETIEIKSTGQILNAGDVISINGSTGEVIKGALEMKAPGINTDLGTILDWAGKQKHVLKVLANADSASDAAYALEHGAEGIGLCRTEHMFFHPSRLNIVQRWILGNEGLEKLEEFQRHDFRELFKAMKNKPVTIRLLDPPLHEFLPHAEQINDDIAKKLGYDDAQKLLSRIESMHEENPMLGYRGCRLGIVRHELTEMQVRAIMYAAADVLKVNTNGNIPHPRIMIPLVGCIKEFEDQALLIKKVVEKVLLDVKMKIRYEIGSMIEVPRAALISDKIANLKDEKGLPLCSFFSFGTNDLTQMTMGISRDDSNTFIPKYLETGIYDEDPFQTIDEEGVGYLVHKSSMDGKRVNPKLSLSVCGEQGGDPKSIQFFHSIGCLNYVSCSPFRVPIALLACGQAAALHHNDDDDLVKNYVV